MMEPICVLIQTNSSFVATHSTVAAGPSSHMRAKDVIPGSEWALVGSSRPQLIVMANF